MEQFYPFANDQVLAELERYRSMRKTCCGYRKNPEKYGRVDLRMKERVSMKNLRVIHGECNKFIRFNTRAELPGQVRLREVQKCIKKNRMHWCKRALGDLITDNLIANKCIQIET